MPDLDKLREDDRQSADQVHRVDGPHLATPKVDETSDVPEETLKAAAGLDQTRNPEQFRAQAGQVARHLRQRRSEIDRREAELNARISQLESEVRLSRLWIQERSHEFEQRESELQNEVSDLTLRLQTAAAAEVAEEQHQEREEVGLVRERQELKRQTERLGAGQKRLAEETQRLDKTRIDLREQRERQERIVAAEHQKLQQQRQTLAQKERAMLAKLRQHRESLDERECQLSSASRKRIMQPPVAYQLTPEAEQTARQLDDERRQLEKERQRLREDARQAHRAVIEKQDCIAKTRQAEGEEVRSARALLDSRRQELERREACLVQLKDQIGSMYQEVLEMRLVTEQLWGQIREAISPAELTRSISQLRGRMADQYRFAQQQLVQDKEELRQLAKRLDASRTALLRKRDEFQAWATRRQEETEEQAARLVAQESKLDHDQERMHESELDWHRERDALQNEIRRLSQAQAS